jgi:hypothetical protein
LRAAPCAYFVMGSQWSSSKRHGSCPGAVADDATPSHVTYRRRSTRAPTQTTLQTRGEYRMREPSAVGKQTDRNAIAPPRSRMLHALCVVCSVRPAVGYAGPAHRVAQRVRLCRAQLRVPQARILIPPDDWSARRTTRLIVLVIFRAVDKRDDAATRIGQETSHALLLPLRVEFASVTFGGCSGLGSGDVLFIFSVEGRLRSRSSSGHRPERPTSRRQRVDRALPGRRADAVPVEASLEPLRQFFRVIRRL